MERQEQYLYYIIDPSFQGVKKLFFHLSEDNSQRARHAGCFLATVEIKNYNIMIDGQNVLDQPVKNNLIRYDNIQKITTSHGECYATACLLDWPYFKEL